MRYAGQCYPGIEAVMHIGRPEFENSIALAFVRRKRFCMKLWRQLRTIRNWRISEWTGNSSVLRINRASRTVSKHIFHLNLIPSAVTTRSDRPQIVSIKQHLTRVN